MQLFWVKIPLGRNCPGTEEKSNNDLWPYEQLNIVFLEDPVESLVSETFNMDSLDSGLCRI